MQQATNADLHKSRDSERMVLPQMMSFSERRKLQIAESKIIAQFPWGDIPGKVSVHYTKHPLLCACM